MLYSGAGNTATLKVEVNTQASNQVFSNPRSHFVSSRLFLAAFLSVVSDSSSDSSDLYGYKRMMKDTVLASA